MWRLVRFLLLLDQHQLLILSGCHNLMLGKIQESHQNLLLPKVHTASAPLPEATQCHLFQAVSMKKGIWELQKVFYCWGLGSCSEHLCPLLACSCHLNCSRSTQNTSSPIPVAPEVAPSSGTGPTQLTSVERPRSASPTQGLSSTGEKGGMGDAVLSSARRPQSAPPTQAPAIALSLPTNNWMSDAERSSAPRSLSPSPVVAGPQSPGLQRIPNLPALPKVPRMLRRYSCTKRARHLASVFIR